jgi:hypothetical protein
MLLGAGAIVTGKFTDLGDVFSLSLKAINMDTATVAVSLMEDVAKSSRIKTLLASGGGAGGSTATTGRTGTASSGTAAQAAPEVQTYKIGDVGPAGGLIFYDKGNNSGGWRYLEAAPAETDLTATEWCTMDAYRQMDRDGIIPYSADSTKKVGTGKTNTQDIDIFAKENGGGFGWASVECADLSINGFDDWFLPSSDELNYMYGNLHRKGLGEFRDVTYWSSTTQTNGQGIWIINFSDGKEDRGYVAYNERCRVRAVRQF